MPRLGGIDSHYFDADGFPLQGGELYFYETGTSTAKSTYNDEAETYPNSWPVVLDAAGVPPSIFYTGEAKIVLQDAAGNILRTLDPVEPGSYEVGDPVLYRLGSIDSQFFDDNGDPLSSGKLYVYENGTSTPKTTYSDNALSVENDWPVVLDSVGFLGDVFYQGKANLVLDDQHDVQQRELDEVETFDYDNTTCVWEAPDTETDIVAELVWVDDEVYNPDSKSFIHGVLGVYQDQLIWNGEGARIFHSSDGGDTVTETGVYTTLPLTETLFQWQYYDGTWYAQIRQASSPISSSHMESTTNGTSWTEGDDLWNGQYSTFSFLIDDGVLLYNGRAPTAQLNLARYSSLLGSSTQPAAADRTIVAGAENGYKMELLTDGYFLSYISSGVYVIKSYDADLTEVETYIPDNWIIANNSWLEGNDTDTVLISNGQLEVLQWNAASPTTGDLDEVTITTPPAGGRFFIGHKSTNWVLVGANQTPHDEWTMHHSTDSDGSNFVPGPKVILPSTQTTSGSTLPQVMNIYSGENAYWYAYYIDSNSFLTVIRFPYGTQGGICPETP